MSKIEIETPPRPLNTNNHVEQSFRAAFHADLSGRRRRQNPRLISADGVRWVCARVMPGREFLVADYLEMIGFRTFCPHGVKLYKRARVGDQRKPIERDYPVFGSYVFVGEPQGLFVGKHTHWYIADVLRSAGGRYLPPAFVEMASRAWTEGRWDGRIDLRDRLEGKAVRIVSGPMEGWQAVVDRLPSELRAVVKVKMFGSTRPVTVDVASLEVI